MIILLGFLLIGGIITTICLSCLFRKRSKQEKNSEVVDLNSQIVTIHVKGGYSPDRMIAKKGTPVRFEFLREDKTPFLETLVFPELNKILLLPYGQKVYVEFLPPKSGTYTFMSQFGVYKGSIIVKD